MKCQQWTAQTHEHEGQRQGGHARHEELASNHIVLWKDDRYSQDDQDQRNQAAISYKALPPKIHVEKHSAHQVDEVTNHEKQQWREEAE